MNAGLPAQSIAAIVIAALSALVVIIGWAVAHRSNLRRDALAKRRELRVKYLLDAYRRLEEAARSPTNLTEAWRAFESAAADIQLLGTREQIDVLLEYLRQVRDDRAQIDPLLKLLRDDLRKELDLAVDVPAIHQFKFTPIPRPETSKTP